MTSLLLLAYVLTGWDLGGRVGAAFPSAGLELQHNSSALLGASLGYSTGRSRFELDYSFTELPGRLSGPYRLELHELSADYGFEFLRRPTWGFSAQAGAGYALARRSLLGARETGWAPSGHLGIGFVQHQGKSRLRLGLDHTLFVESTSDGSTRRVSLANLLGVQAGVAYVF